MATKSFEELNTGALTIKNNELPESNTHTLVGTQLVDMVAKEQEIDGKVNDLATGEGSNIDILKFNPETVAQLEQIGQVRYNPATQCLEVKLNDEVTLSVGLENYMRGKNADSIDLESPMVVFVSGGLGANALLTRASNDAVSGEKVIGVITQGIAKNNIGFVTTSGIVNSIDTSAYAEGDVLWLGTNGTLTNVKPDVSVNQICIGVVLRSHATEGSLLVAIKDDWRGQVAQLRSDLSENVLLKKIEGIKISSGNNLLTRNYVEPSNPKEYEKGGANRLINNSGLVVDYTGWYLSPLIEWGDNTQSIMTNCRCWAQYANDGITLVDIYRPTDIPTENNTLINKANDAFFFRVGIALVRGNTMLNYGNVLLPYEPYKDIVTKRAYGETPLYFQANVDEVARFKEMLLSESYIPQSPTYTDGIINSPINVLWADGGTGRLTLTRTNGLVTKIVATKIIGEITITTTMNITRDADGNVTNITFN